MMTVRKASIFPAPRSDVLSKFQKLETLQYIAAPYATFIPVSTEGAALWKPGSVSSYYFKLFRVIPCEKFDEMEGVSSKEGNIYVPVWNHDFIKKRLMISIPKIGTK